MVLNSLAFAGAHALTSAVLGRPLFDLPPLLSSAMAVGSYVVDLGLALAIVRRSRGGDMSASGLGLVRAPFLPSLGWVVLAWLCTSVAVALWGLLALIVLGPEIFDGAGVLGQWALSKGTAAVLAEGLVVLLVAPVIEEIVFRGVIFRALWTWRGPGVAALITAILFGLWHVGTYPLAVLPTLAITGFFLCLVFRRTGSLLPPIALHMLINTLAFLRLYGTEGAAPLAIGLAWGAAGAALAALLTVPRLRPWQAPQAETAIGV